MAGLSSTADSDSTISRSKWPANRDRTSSRKQAFRLKTKRPDDIVRSALALEKWKINFASGARRGGAPHYNVLATQVYRCPTHTSQSSQAI